MTTPRSLSDGLRDPTREELFNGPTREKLPVEIQQMAQDETACTFCGVSYFVFSEVQELQATVKRYKKTFHDFVRFMERERRISQELRAQVVSLKKSVDEGVAACGAMVTSVGLESQRLRSSNEQLTTQLHQAQRDAGDKQHEMSQLQSQWRRDEEEWKMASALTEQKLRNEILHLSSQLEKCRLLSASQETEFTAGLERERCKIKELEVVIETTRASMAAAERLAITERDLLKQQLLAAGERVEAERETAKQLETQLRAVQHELQRVVASNDSERSAFTQLQNDLAILKQRLLQHEKAEVSLEGERSVLIEKVEKSTDLARSLRAEIFTLERKVEASAIDTENHKQQFARELEKIRLEHGHAINRMQRDHQKAIDDLKQQQATYIEYLQKQTCESAAVTANALQQALVETEGKLRDVEKQLAHTRNQLQESGDELQKLRLHHHQATTRAQTLERRAEEVSNEKDELATQLECLQRQHDQLQSSMELQLRQLKQETTTVVQKQFDEERIQLQRRIDGLHTKCDQLRRDNELLIKQKSERHGRNPEDEGEEHSARRQQAWGDGERAKTSDKRTSSREAAKSSNNNQDISELEKLVVSLRRTLDQKDKEILLLQQTVHRECLERTSLLEKMKSGKVLPDLGSAALSSSSMAIDSSIRKSLTLRHEPATTNGTDGDEHEDRDVDDSDPSQPKASFYERLRRAGQRKPKIRKQ